MIRRWRLEDGTRTFLVVAEGDALPQAIRWGASLPDADAAALHRADAADLTGEMLDAHPDPSLCPEASHSFPGQAGLVVADLLPL